MILLLLITLKFAWANPVPEPSGHLAPALGKVAVEVGEKLKALQYAAEEGKRPEEKLESGDVLIFLDQEGGSSSFMPPAWNNGMQGFGHAALVAKHKGKLIHLESPMSRVCEGDFRGTRPYIVLRPRKQTIGAIPASKEKFQGAVDQLAERMLRFGYDYDPSFSVSVLNMNPEERAKLKTKIMTHKGEGSPIPGMYCSAVPVTVYALLGVMPTNAISAVDLIRMGVEKEVAAGKTKAEVAEETSRGIISIMSGGHEQAAVLLQQTLEVADASPEEKAFAKSEIVRRRKLAEDIKLSEGELRDLLRQSMNLKPEEDPNGSLIDSAKKRLYFNATRFKTIVRPVDFIKDAATGTGHFEMVGYYSGNLPSTCAKSQPTGEITPVDISDADQSNLPPPPILLENPPPSSSPATR